MGPTILIKTQLGNYTTENKKKLFGWLFCYLVEVRLVRTSKIVSGLYNKTCVGNKGTEFKYSLSKKRIDLSVQLPVLSFKKSKPSY